MWRLHCVVRLKARSTTGNQVLRGGIVRRRIATALAVRDRLCRARVARRTYRRLATRQRSMRLERLTRRSEQSSGGLGLCAQNQSVRAAHADPDNRTRPPGGRALVLSAVPDQARIVVSGRAASPVRSPDTPHAQATAPHDFKRATHLQRYTQLHPIRIETHRLQASTPRIHASASIAHHRRSSTHRTGIIHLCPQLAAR